MHFLSFNMLDEVKHWKLMIMHIKMMETKMIVKQSSKVEPKLAEMIFQKIVFRF